MSEYIKVTGMVLKAVPVFENDKRVILLTSERGKVTVFARGAKKPSSRFLAATNSLCMGEFHLFEGKTAYNLGEVHITDYFDALRSDLEGALYGMYFADLIDYCCKENMGGNDELNLLYVTLKALSRDDIPNRLVQSLFEIKLMVIEGEFPGIRAEKPLMETTKNTIRRCVTSPLSSLYSFSVSEDVIAELLRECDIYRESWGHRFASLDILNSSVSQTS